MHPRHAAIFGIENLELNQHFRQATTEHSVVDEPPLESSINKSHTDILDINATLLADLNKAIAPQTLTQVIYGPTITWQSGVLSLPNSQLNSTQKRALWALMSDKIDNL